MYSIQNLNLPPGVVPVLKNPYNSILYLVIPTNKVSEKTVVDQYEEEFAAIIFNIS